MFYTEHRRLEHYQNKDHCQCGDAGRKNVAGWKTRVGWGGVERV